MSTMTADPSPVFLAAALVSGLAEGSVVIGHYRRVLQLQHCNYSPKPDGNGVVDSGHKLPPVPSVHVSAAHAILYGLASVPLGIVGASPGQVLLPKSFSSPPMKNSDAGEGTAASDTAPQDDKIGALNSNHAVEPDILQPTSSNTPVVTGRGMGRMLRHENARKMQTIQKNRKLMKGSASASTHFSGASRYVATLDGSPLPTPAAEALRRLRSIVVGAGIASYAVTLYLSNQQDKVENARQLVTNCTYGRYDYWNNAKMVNLWIERISFGKSIDEMELLKRLRAQHEKGGVVSIHKSAHMKQMCDAAWSGLAWINLQFEEDDLESSINDEDSTAEIDCTCDTDGRSEDAKEGKAIDPIAFQLEPDPPQPSRDSNLWVAVDVLGTSIRHLAVSSYRLVSSVASVGRQGQSQEKKEDVD